MNRFLRICLAVGLALCMAPAVPLRAQQGGLDAPQAVGAFFNAKFPAQTPGGTGGWTVVDAFPNLRFIDPVKLVAQPRSSRLHVLGKDGYIWSFENNAATSAKTTVLDIRTRVQSTDNTGLVGMAFHPDFGLSGSPNRGYFYVFYYYTPQPQSLPGTDTDGIANPPPWVANEGDETLNHTCVRLSRFNIPDGSSTADPGSELVLIQQFDRQAWHNGGSLCFGTDGFLYFAIGDEGLDSDYYRSMQRFNERLQGGVFRIDVNKDPAKSHPIRRQPQFQADAYGGVAPVLGTNHTFSQDYYIPNDNPWQSPGGTMLEEYWAIGVRSPHTMTCDPLTGQLWLGDVGQATWEEVNLIVKGGDYQWPYREGREAFVDQDWGRGALSKTHTLASTQQPPVWDYTHSNAQNISLGIGANREGTSVIGGYVYRGTQHAAALYGKYLFSDHGNPTLSHLWALTPGTNGGAATVELLTDMPTGGFHSNIAAWGRDHAGEVYMLTLGRAAGASVDNSFVPPVNSSGQMVAKQEVGRIWKLARTGANNPEPPLTLSAVGAFTNLATRAPAAGFLPYAPANPFWSDHAEKLRWVAIPNDGTHNTAAERVGFASADPWTFPAGTVFMKHFDLPVSDVNPSLKKPLETRFFVKGTDGTWYGVTYRWRDDGSDADLLFGTQTQNISITTATGTRSQTWTFPSRSDCMTCHNTNAGSVLGFGTHHLNADYIYPQTGRTANQLLTFGALGILSPAPAAGDLASLPRACRHDDLTQPLELRARSWLDSNCAACHRPGGANANWDARLTTPLASAGILNGPLKKSYAIAGEAALRPHDPDRSLIHVRAASLAPALIMPPVGKTVNDDRGLETVRAWIDSMSPAGDTATGLKGTYFADKTLTTPVFRRVDAPLSIAWPSGSPDARIPADNFSVRWTGRLLPPTTGSYRLHAYSDEGIRVWIDGVLAVDDWTAHTQRDTLSAALNFTAGVPVNVRVDYYEGTGDARAELAWDPPGAQGRTVIPAANLLFPRPENRPPTAVNDTLQTARGSSATLSLITNDFDHESNLAPATVAVQRQPGSGSVASAGGGSVIYTATAGLSGTADTFTYRVQDTAGAWSNEALVSVAITPHWRGWLDTYFSPAAQADPLTGDWNADPDKDGAPNLMEYLSGTSPVSISSVARPAVRRSGGNIEIVLPRDPLAEVNIAAEASTDALSWTSPADLSVTLAAGEVIGRMPAGTGRRFLRIRLTLR